MSCTHQPACPPASAPDCEAAIVVASHPEQGWSLLCNGVVVFEDPIDRQLPRQNILAIPVSPSHRVILAPRRRYLSDG